MTKKRSVFKNSSIQQASGVLKRNVFKIASGLIACGLAVTLMTTGTEAEAGDQIVMKIATVAPKGTPWEKQLRKFKKLVEERTGGKVKVKMFMGGSLGGEKSLVRRTAQGSIAVFGGSTAALGEMVPELNVIESPYLFDSAKSADKALDNAKVLGIVKEAVHQKGFVYAFWAENGFRSWFTKEKAIKKPSDLKGLRMRSQESKVHLATYKALGASPVPIDVTNVLTSLQTNVVDGFDNTPLFAMATSWYQAAKHFTQSEHCYQPGAVVISRKWLDKQPKEIQDALKDIPTDLIAYGRKNVRKMDPVLVKNFERAGIKVHKLSSGDRAAFKKATASVAKKVAAKSGKKGKALLSALQAAK